MFFELWNPTAQHIEYSCYYLTMNVLYSVNLLYMGISKMYILSVNIKVCWLVWLAHKNSNYVNEDIGVFYLIKSVFHIV